MIIYRIYSRNRPLIAVKVWDLMTAIEAVHARSSAKTGGTRCKFLSGHAATINSHYFMYGIYKNTSHSELKSFLSAFLPFMAIQRKAMAR